MTNADPTIAIRQGEHLDINRLDAYLKQHIEGLTGEPDVRQFPGGASNLTYRFSYPGKNLILRRPPLGPLPKGAHNMVREAELIQAIEPQFNKVPHIYLLCTDPTILGCDFYVMEELEGLILRREMPTSVDATPDQCAKLCDIFIQGLADLHALDTARTGLERFGKGDGYVERQVGSWTERLAKAHTDDTPDFTSIGRWLAENQPADRATCLIHNDYRFDNLILDPTDFRIKGVLDWELATIGDPLMDLGTALAYWVQADDHPAMLAIRPQPTHLPGMMSRNELVAAYFDRQPDNAPVDFRFYEVFGLFRLAGILQQIYHRYRQGQTNDKRFAGFGQVVTHLHDRCREITQA